MRTLYLLRHSLTEGNERRLYYGSTDLPLSPSGRSLALKNRGERPLPCCEKYVSSGLIRASETLLLLTGREPDLVLPELQEMRFGAFEMHSYEELKENPDYQRWISDMMTTGTVRCPGGESQREFHERVLSGGERLIAEEWVSAIAVVHGGVVANLMSHWFPEEPRNFFEWQPGPCDGYRVGFNKQTPVEFKSVQEAITQ